MHPFSHSVQPGRPIQAETVARFPAAQICSFSGRSSPPLCSCRWGKSVLASFPQTRENALRGELRSPKYRLKDMAHIKSGALSQGYFIPPPALICANLSSGVWEMGCGVCVNVRFQRLEVAPGGPSAEGRLSPTRYGNGVLGRRLHRRPKNPFFPPSPPPVRARRVPKKWREMRCRRPVPLFWEAF